MQSAMNIDGLDQYQTGSGLPPSHPGPARSEISFNLSEAGHNDQNFEDPPSARPAATADRELLNMALSAEMDKQINQPTPLDANQRKVDSKDSQWKPAPIIGREMTLGQRPQYPMGNQPPQMASTIQQNLENQQRHMAMRSEPQYPHMSQEAPRATMPEQFEPSGFEHRLAQLREESSHMEVQMRLNNSQNNYQMPI